jgi:hypothetical protein
VVHPFDDRTHLKAALMERAASLENTVGHPDTDAILGEAQ